MPKFPQRTAPETSLPQDWLENLSGAHGNPIRLLLIGNVANYAYVTAKLMRSRDIEVIVLEPDFYHIMASPEWHEIDAIGDYGDDYMPKWSVANVSKYRRPDWFIQGPWDTVFRQLEAQEFGSKFSYFKAKMANKLASRITRQDLPNIVYDLIKSDQRFIRRGRQAISKLLRWPTTPNVDPVDTLEDDQAEPLVIADIETKTMEPVVNHIESVDVAESLPTDFKVQDQLPEIASLPGQEVPTALQYIVDRKAYFQRLFESFDAVVGFTTLGYYPAAINHPNFASIELGTIRGLPFEDSDLGRLTRWVYQVSPKTLVTNTDCIPAARKLDLRSQDVHPILHPICIDELVEFCKQHVPSQGIETPYFFAPARHHWEKGNSSILKGNDVYLKAAGKLYKAGYDFRLRLVKWGAELDQTNALIAKLGIEHLVDWIPPQPRKALWPVYKNALAVIDQFGCPAIGGVSLESMGLGQRVITRFDWQPAKQFYPTEPPLMKAKTVADVVKQMRVCLDDQDDKRQTGLKGQKWMNEAHGEDRQLELIISALMPLFK